MYFVLFIRFERIRWRPYSLFALSAPFVFVIARIDETKQQNNLSSIANESRPSFNGDGSQHAVITCCVINDDKDNVNCMVSYIIHSDNLLSTT